MLSEKKRKEQIIYDPTQMRYLKVVKFVGTESRMVGPRAEGRRE